LHEGPEPFVMPNPWDGASALLLARAGFRALASSSFAVAGILGRPDGERAVSREEAIANAAFIAASTGLPVNGDLEDGYGSEPSACATTVDAAVAAGLAGLGIEDTTADPDRPIHDFDAAVRRVRAAAERARDRIVLTARADNFINGRPDLDDTIRRLVAFAEAGADVLYAPGLPDMDAIRAVVRAVAPKPVNVLIGPRSGTARLNDLGAAGVRRVSTGGALYRQAMSTVARLADELRAGEFGGLAGGLTYAALGALFSAP
jgi:2-methylisocitrate lyase-like PEP mutase family enzyme